MAFIHDDIFDSGLEHASSIGTRIDIIDLDPGGTYSCVTTNTLGNKTSISWNATANATSGTGRYISTVAVSDGSVTDTGTATYWAITNATDTVIASGALSSSQSVTSSNTFTLDSIQIIIRDATTGA